MTILHQFLEWWRALESSDQRSWIIGAVSVLWPLFLYGVGRKGRNVVNLKNQMDVIERLRGPLGKDIGLLRPQLERTYGRRFVRLVLGEDVRLLQPLLERGKRFLRQVPETGASTVICTLAARPGLVRAEGITEAIEDIVLSLTGGQPGLAFDVAVSLNVNVTNTVSAEGTVDAVLMPDGPGRECAAIRGKLDNVNRVLFRNVQINPGLVKSTFRIVGLRVNVSQLGIPGSSMLEGSDPRLISAFVKVVSQGRSGVDVSYVNQLLTVDHVCLGLVGSFLLPNGGRGPVDYSQAAANGQALYGPGGNRVRLSFLALLREGFGGAFTSIETEGTQSGSRFLVRFDRIPVGVDFYVTTGNVSESGLPDIPTRAALVLESDGNGAGGQIASAEAAAIETAHGVPLLKLNSSGGHAEAVWEWTGEDRRQVEKPLTAYVGIAVVVPPDVFPDGSSVLGSVSFAPLSTVTTADKDQPVPRFISTFGDPGTVFTSWR